MQLHNAPLPIQDLKHSTEELDLSFQNLTSDDVFLVLQLLKLNDKLEVIDLSGNPIGNEGIEIIAESLEQLHLKGIKCYEMNIRWDETIR